MEAKVRTASNQVINLVPSTSPQASNAFSLTNLPAGVYALDVITQKGNTKAAYEGILAIGQQPLTVIEETTRRVTNEYGDLILIFLPVPPKDCPTGFELINGECQRIICPDGSEVPLAKTVHLTHAMAPIHLQIVRNQLSPLTPLTPLTRLIL
jgi:hypothetical protein